MNLDGKIAVITGASGGLGGAVTRRFVEAGAKVAAVERDEAKLQALHDELVELGEVVPMRCDVTVAEQVEALMRQVHEKMGGPHILLNIVGGWAGGKTVADHDEALWDKMIDLNLKSAFLCTKYALGYMIEQDYGRIVSVSSKAAESIQSKVVAYAVSKGGVITLTKCVAHEVRGTGVSAAAVLPSVIDTPPNRKFQPKADYSKWVLPEQIADVMLGLASEEGGAVNGAIVPVYGGM